MSDEPKKPRMIRADQTLQFVYLKYGAYVVHPFITALFFVLLSALWAGLVEGKDARIGMFWVFVVTVTVAIIGLCHAFWHFVRVDMLISTAEREMAKEEERWTTVPSRSPKVLGFIFATSIFTLTLGPIIYRWVFYYYTFSGDVVIDGKVF